MASKIMTDQGLSDLRRRLLEPALIMAVLTEIGPAITLLPSNSGDNGETAI
jgi:hypothetical protein